MSQRFDSPILMAFLLAKSISFSCKYVCFASLREVLKNLFTETKSLWPHASIHSIIYNRMLGKIAVFYQSLEINHCFRFYDEDEYCDHAARKDDDLPCYVAIHDLFKINTKITSNNFMF